ncbi:metallopeptidase family protein [Candidatus Saccharibacteria bacterium]|nr:metallopeptidase family protein [Candidatus Saccharibacteria bacterium]
MIAPPTDAEFNDLIARAMDELPPGRIKGLDNVAITYADNPTPEQLRKTRDGGLLLGLYEGIPLTKRGAGYNLVLPDKITLFKIPLATIARDEEDFREQIKHTLWHEIAHFYGLDHDDIRARERTE